MTKLKTIFMGTPDTACPFLEYLICQEDVVGVFSAEDTPAGRHMQIKIPPVKELALKHNIPVFQPHSFCDPNIVDELKKIDPDIIVVVAYGHKIPAEILSLPKYGCINIHFSLLPKYRGAAPVAWSIAYGEKETGVSSFFLSEKLDAGDIIAQQSIPINDTDNAELLLYRLIPVGINVLKESLALIRMGNPPRIKQAALHSSNAPKLRKVDAHINWNESNYEIHNKLRAFFPWPGAYTFLIQKNQEIMFKLFDSALGTDESLGKIGEIIEVNKDKGVLVQCGKGSIWFHSLQMANHKKLTAYELVVGHKLKKGDVFES